VLTVQVEGTQQASLIQAHVRLYSLQRFNASSVTKNEASIALSFPQEGDRPRRHARHMLSEEGRSRLKTLTAQRK